ncbi:SMI1/KNR4 family protein [Pedosphaera parvula]|uniref:Knr4/Smi1-like domain-containing protein n=1 Tax=Pedosphaera parvula (strain Ellin514) TaxID=320771 RepID=B9XLR1_PEDPL|nr:SMI1/KNR4 family protein [Pedosphaera parvula]EEF59168.1 hypothetical protein Cflav_PD2373 [Pedosphaera parvula Ellin514]
MLFENQDTPVSLAEIQSLEAELGIRFPDSLKKLFLENNGGSPIPYVLRTEDHYTTVSETLPMKSSKGRGTAIDSYKTLVLKRNLVPRQLFPFAVDSGGDYFFVDCTPSRELVYLYKADCTFGENLSNLCMSLENFWNSLVDEE